ncbi:uncharacterized protein NECHADRAFT_86878 [Fusarium vanettenii 77-13-4]|uniref:Uncharacterized protein n=1 Tax=Fusarium vanettenii (strain ATCC MYA-4622 / CBS 123669 / FGSC 9596 / NRRL 45880 / 77-13-4) TaxID=660122 RepID=C7ZHV3_FUSV7|nr:uncharacterized protein NECHADRAFT_86878 [Fusarium vanettenii 77-13-4]EEU36348.1 hypothetical protein NECHADRAFT_86878 [Fusarium vanettenii 77-13-4]
MAKTSIPVGFVGLSSKPEWSWAVAAHLPYFAQSTNYKIATLQNSSAETAKKAIEVHKLGDDVHAHGDVQSIASDPNVDLVAIAVKVPLHAAVVEAALNAGKSVFCECPLARNADEAERLASLAQEKGAKTLIGLQGRQDPVVLKAKELVAAGTLGDILQTTMLFTSPWFGGTMPESNVYGVDIDNGANLMTISVGHSLDTLCYVLGELHGIQANLANNRPEVTVTNAAGNPKGTVKKTSHDNCSATGTLPGGGVATAICQGGTSTIDKNFFWEIMGTKGTLLLKGPMGNVQGFPPTIKFIDAKPEAKPQPIEVPRATGFEYNTGKAWDAFAGEGAGETPDFQVAQTRHRMLEAIYRSNEKGTREDYV